jgi:imidazolonepropionase-like amidohydrolase
VTAFVDVNVVPMDTERVLANQTVLVEGGRITALGPAGQVTVPAGAVRIDGRGKYLIPGLGDMHAHVNAGPGSNPRPFLFGYVAHGVTTVRHVGGASAQEIMDLETTLISPRTYVGTWGTGTGLQSMRSDSVTAKLAAYKTVGYDFLFVTANEVHARDTLPAVDSLLTATRRLRLPLATHDHEQDFAKVLALAAAGGSSEHLYAFWDLLTRPEAEKVSAAELQARAAAAQRAGAWITVTLVCTEYGERRIMGDIDVARRVVKALQDAGAGILLGSDANGGRGSSGGVVHEELAALVRAGLTPYQALRTGTRNVAEYFGLLDSSGTVAEGKWADLVLVNNNPLQDIRHVRELAGVMIRGRWLDRAELDRGLLADPKHWFRFEVWGSMLPPKPGEDGFRKLRGDHVGQFNALTDSLTAAKASGPAGASTYQRLLREQADKLGAMRAILPPAHQAAFDPHARVWLREQTRQGYRVAIPGVAPVP